ncbi:polysaccharide deacetylase [Enterovirga sp.]|uniref:polysaccharide deacetylase n=1 Tax=Enterovirga sp. TaxID=2026350 RepID=UPI002602692C|nr:polysaccharide deacetylase [Enterovirga sp.]MDB5591786.1 glycosyltransferase 28 domain protein [Enterovirga sp.]
MSGQAASPIRDALDRAADRDRPIDLWWRDDDAVAHTPALERLLAISARTGCPVAVAAVTARVERSLVDRLAAETDVWVLAHGLHHANHAPTDEKPAEFGPHRPVAQAAAELGQAASLARATFGPRAAPVFVPPWNRISPHLCAALPGAGFRALSASGAPTGRAGPGLPRIDIHLDPVDWRGTRSLAPPDRLAAAARAAIAAGSTALGLLTHHLVFDEALWGFTEAVLEMASAHPAVRLRRIDELLPGPEPTFAPATAHARDGRRQAHPELAP